MTKTTAGIWELSEVAEREMLFLCSIIATNSPSYGKVEDETIIALCGRELGYCSGEASKPHGIFSHN